MSKDTRFHVITLAESFCKSARNIVLKLQNEKDPKQIKLGTTFGEYKEIKSALERYSEDSELDVHRLEMEKWMKRLQVTIQEKKEVVREIAEQELENAVNQLEIYVEDFTDNIGEELADMLDWRTSIHELILLLDHLGVNLQEQLERLDSIDTEIRKYAWWIRKEGIARHKFWIEAAPAEYWWWHLDKIKENEKTK